jgi:hypothetical protein
MGPGSFLLCSGKMDENKLLTIIRKIPEGEVIAGINKSTRYIFQGIEKYDSRGKAPELDGSLVIVLESEKRKRSRIKLFPEVLVSLLTDGKSFLYYGRLPPTYVQKYCRHPKPRVPNLSDYVSHYKSFAKYIYTIMNTA